MRLFKKYGHFPSRLDFNPYALWQPQPTIDHYQKYIGNPSRFMNKNTLGGIGDSALEIGSYGQFRFITKDFIP